MNWLRLHHLPTLEIKLSCLADHEDQVVEDASQQRTLVSCRLQGLFCNQANLEAEGQELKNGDITSGDKRRRAVLLTFGLVLSLNMELSLEVLIQIRVLDDAVEVEVLDQGKLASLQWEETVPRLPNRVLELLGGTQM